VKPFKTALIHGATTAHTPDSLVEQLRREPGVTCLRSDFFDSPRAHYSFVAARPFLTFRSFGSRCELRAGGHVQVQFGNPWRLLESLMSRCELLEQADLPFPLGGCFGYWGYDLKNFVEPKLSRRAVNDLELPDCHVSFYDSLVVFDHRLGKTWIVSTGLDGEGSRDEKRANDQADFWQRQLRGVFPLSFPAGHKSDEAGRSEGASMGIASNLTRSDFLAAVERAQAYIRTGCPVFRLSRLR
jgi:para-aminobenzoate synthetase component 1